MINHPEYLKHKYWMSYALNIAKKAGEAGEIPVGAVIIDDKNNLIATGENRKQRENDPTSHAEIMAIKKASQILKSWHLKQCTMYVTLEPCPMCAGGIILARLGMLVYGVDDPKTGAIRTVVNIPDSKCSNHHLPVLAGILEIECQDLLQSWFKKMRNYNRE